MNAFAALSADTAVRTLDSDEAGLLDVGLMRLCGHDLAVPAINVREVVPLPAQLHPSFSGTGASIGSIVIRGRVIPVLDVAARLGFAPRDSESGVVLILRNEGALIGLVMDSVSGLARVRQSDIQPFAAPGHDGTQIVSCSFPLADALIGLIDPAAVLALPGVPRACEGITRADASGVAIRSAVVLITVADANLAIDASLVVATVPNAQLRPSPMPASKWVGVVRYLGQEVPVVDDLALLGLSGCAADSPNGAVIILRFGPQRMLGLKIDRVQRILPIDDRAVRPLPEALGAQLPLFVGAVVDHEGRQNLLLDRDALTRCEPLRMIGALSREKDGQSSGSAHISGPANDGAERQPFLVFCAGERRRAAPLASVKQIIPLPQTQSDVRRAGSALQGIASYNGAPLPLLDLGGAGGDTDRSEAVVLVVEHGGAFTGLIVDRLDTVTRAVAQQRPGKSVDAAGRFIEAVIGGQPEAVNLCDLGEEVRRIA